jgi:hypothetical protein
VTAARARLAVGLTLAFAAAVALAAAQNAADLPGRVFDAATKSGIPNLQVKLTPPRTVRLPARITSTGTKGEFLVRQLVRGRYLLEISQGVTLLYRAEIDTSKVARVDVPLKRR